MENKQPQPAGQGPAAPEPSAATSPGEPAGPDTSGLLRILSVLADLGHAECGAVVQRVDAGRLTVVTQCPEHPDQGTYPDWLKPYTQVLAEALPQDRDVMPEVVRWVRQPEAQRQGLVWRPVGMDRPWAFVFETTAGRATTFRKRFTQIFETLAGFAALTASQANVSVVQRLAGAIAVLGAINRPRRFLSVAMALCNELASGWGCERVSLGVLRGHSVRLQATSHSARFNRKMRLIQEIEAAMEECLDQDLEVLHPADAAVPTIHRAAAQLAAQHGTGVVLSVPLRLDAEPQAVVTLEWPGERAPDLETVAALRLVGNLCAPRLLNLYRQDRWPTTKAALACWRGVTLLVGPRHAVAKLVLVALVGLTAFAVFGRGMYRAQAPFVVEATTQQSIVAPFDGYIKTVTVEVGDTVRVGDPVLATLDTAELRLELAAARAELAKYRKEADAYMQAGPAQQAQMQMAQAEADRVQARVDLFNHRIARATVTSPIAGTITRGDLKRHVGAPVKTGDLLFEVTPLESLRAVLLVSEDRIQELAAGQTGSVATASYPDRHLDVEIERVYPAAEVVNQRNVFRVRARFTEADLPDWMRPGMEGVSKVEIGKRRWIFIWTRKLVNWIRMTLWI